ncbi:MAG TPA: L,D-transpeptidase family protein [Gaiellales bacterium]|nr:L,D-transpeptidase family protein [Gaiellales bacterium]
MRLRAHLWQAGIALLVPVLLAILVVAGCGGAGAPPSTPAPGGGSGTGGRPTGPDLKRRAFVLYLRAVKATSSATDAGSAATAARLRTVATEPSATQISGAAGTAGASADAVRRATAALGTIRPLFVPPSAHRQLVHWSRTTAVGLRLVARGLRDWPSGEAGMGRRRLRRAADAALAWEGAMRRIAARRGMVLPRWVSARTRRAQALSHAADVVFRPVRMTSGATGAIVTAFQVRLAALGYLPPGYASGAYDYQTMQATMAFQGWEGLTRDGVAGPNTMRALRTAERPAPWSSEDRHMEVHKAQQVLLLVDGGAVVGAIHVSTAAPGHVTPDGTFTIYRKERMSWSVPFQVWMPYASYFTGGYALHEYPDVPPYPASHGCIRVPAGDSVVVWSFATIGTPVTIG